MRLCYFRLSASHPTLPLSELKAIFDVIGDGFVEAIYGPIAIVSCKNPSKTVEATVERGGLIKWGGLLVGIYSSEEELVEHVPSQISEVLQLCSSTPCRIEAHRLQGLWRDADTSGTARILAGRLEGIGAKLSPRGTRILEVLYSEGVIVVGLRLKTVNTKAFEERKPSKRPFFKPGPLDVRLSRALVNLSRLREEAIFWDPFCGTGGIVLEACLLGASRCLCGDISPEMSRGSSRNLSHYGMAARSLPYVGDALRAPLASGIVDSIATDPPYGRSTTLGGRGRRDIYRGFLVEASERLKRGSYIVFAAPAEEEPHLLAEETGLIVVERHYMYVHGSLTREIVVARRP
ncbi:MAG: RsmD family RNA methyltransferase [Desulfurococcales archaeon]|nr:RsmD family RNA methyltransferase [Desulfurococcales archaeon]